MSSARHLEVLFNHCNKILDRNSLKEEFILPQSFSIFSPWSFGQMCTGRVPLVPRGSSWWMCLPHKGSGLNKVETGGGQEQNTPKGPIPGISFLQIGLTSFSTTLENVQVTGDQGFNVWTCGRYPHLNHNTQQFSSNDLPNRNVSPCDLQYKHKNVHLLIH